MSTEFDDIAVFSACLAGDELAWRRLIDRYSGLVSTIARAHRLAPHDAHDVCQATWTNVLLHLNQVRSPERLSAWIGTTARRECLKHIERGRRYVPVGDAGYFDLHEHSALPPEDEALRTIVSAEIRIAFAQLPARDQRLLGVLMSDEAPNYNAVSKRLGIPRGSIGPLRGRALARLRDLLPEQAGDGVAA